MAARESHGKKLEWIVKVTVISAVVIIALVSAHDDGRLDALRRGITGLWADVPAVQAQTQGSDVSDFTRVHFIDVGQGKSILIEAPEKTVLIDAGENNKGEAVLRYLAEHKIKKLDIAIGTHPHSDHIGGLDTVIRAISVDKIILPVIPEDLSPTTPTYFDLLNDISSKNLKITPARHGDKYDLGGGAVLKILGPLHSEYLSLNDFSVVSRLDYGSDSFLFTGDATSVAERDMLESGLKLRASVLDVGHHGSRSSSSKAFIEAVGPSVAVISCGVDNSYGHPHRQTVQRIKKLGDVKIYRTDLNGSVVITSGGGKLVCETKK